IAGSTNYAIRHRELGSNGAWTEATSLRAWRRLFSLAACTDYEVQFRNYKNGAWNCWSVSDYFTTTGCAKSFNPGTKGGSDDWQVFPNPATNTLNIVLNENMLDKSVRLTLRDQLGRTVWSKNIENLETPLVELNVREYNLAAGVYTLSLQNDESTTALQVIVNR